MFRGETGKASPRVAFGHIRTSGTGPLCPLSPKSEKNRLNRQGSGKKKNGINGLMIQFRLRTSMGGSDFLTGLRLNSNTETESFITGLRGTPAIKRSFHILSRMMETISSGSATERPFRNGFHYYL